jgi:hypothetical protein
MKINGKVPHETLEIRDSLFEKNWFEIEIQIGNTIEYIVFDKNQLHEIKRQIELMIINWKNDNNKL